jgi:hypothetical protein
LSPKLEAGALLELGDGEREAVELAHQGEQVGGHGEAEGGLDAGDEGLVGRRAVAEVTQQVVAFVRAGALVVDGGGEALDVFGERRAEVVEGEQGLAGGDELGVFRGRRTGRPGRRTCCR